MINIKFFKLRTFLKLYLFMKFDKIDKIDQIPLFFIFYLKTKY
jgi:hypothetical protein